MNKAINKKRNTNIYQVGKILLSINASFNNTIITASHLENGNVISSISAGMAGFKGTKKGTPYAASTAMKNFLEKLKNYQPEELYVQVSGAGSGRDAALRALTGSGLKVVQIKDVTPIPHNGCRAKKPRRV